MLFDIQIRRLTDTILGIQFGTIPHTLFDKMFVRNPDTQFGTSLSIGYQREPLSGYSKLLVFLPLVAI